MFKQKEYIIIFTILITEVLGFSLILPFLPLFAKDLGATPLIIGFILMSFSLCQFISAPIMGKLSDKYGRKPLLLFSQFSTFVSFIILGFSNTIFLIFISRIVDGILGSNMTIAKAYLIDITPKKKRSKAFGLFGVAFGIGFLIGPGIGGSLASLGYSIPSFLAAGTSLVTMVLTYFFLPETVKKNDKHIKLSFKLISDTEIFKKILKHKKTKTLLSQYFTFATANMVFVTTFALYAAKQFNFSTSQIGLILTYVGLNTILFRGFILNKLIDYFTDETLITAGYLIEIIALFLLTQRTSMIVFFIGISGFAVGSGILRPLLNSAISKSGHHEDQGSVMGITSSASSMSQIIGPLVGGFLIEFFFPGSLPLVSAILITGAYIIQIRSKKNM